MLIALPFSTLSFFLMKHVIREQKKKRKGTRERERERKRERERGRVRGRGRGRGRGGGGRGSGRRRGRGRGTEREEEEEKEKETYILKWTGPSHGPGPWKFVEQLFFHKGLISDLILLGTAGKHHFLQNKCQYVFFLTQTFFSKKHSYPRFLATIVILPNSAWVQNKLETIWHNREPSH